MKKYMDALVCFMLWGEQKGNAIIHRCLIGIKHLWRKSKTDSDYSIVKSFVVLFTLAIPVRLELHSVLTILKLAFSL